ncbi:hypothetical protein [uncultured Chryseobacterium sp.]|uniref:hypothetical protein n=1 Tax=uncultured Chryseobacterium sp. TaxID=259322 RepID=UPI0025E6B041|nr:hypothetical protein [uncultured Chryseobacterium sp.]
MEKLFTIIVDYKGGTYISQYSASNIKSLKEKWIEEELPKLTALAGFNSYQVSNIKERMFNEEEIKYENLINVWNNDLGTISKYFFSMIIINTEKI